MLQKRYQYKNKRAVTKMTADQIVARDQLQDKIDSQGFLNDPLTQCWCGGSQFQPFSERTRFGLKAKSVLCNSCGSIAISPRFSDSNLRQFYKEYYRSLSAPEFFKNPESLFKNQVKLGKKILEFLPDELLVTPGEILDIGCACGGTLTPFKALGWQVRGCDYDERQVEYGKDRGFDIDTGGLEAVEKDLGQFDIILLSDVLEHQRNPLFFLTRIKKLLRKDGVVYVQFPGIRDLEKTDYPDVLRSLQLAHLFYWDLTQLDFLFCLAGFEMVKGNEIIQAVFKPSQNIAPAVIEKKKKSLAGYHETIISYLKNAEQNRFKLFLKNNKELIFRQPKAFMGRLVFLSLTQFFNRSS